MASQGYREDHQEAGAGSQEFAGLSDAQGCWDTLQSWLPEFVGGEGGGRKRI